MICILYYANLVNNLNPKALRIEKFSNILQIWIKITFENQYVKTAFEYQWVQNVGDLKLSNTGEDIFLKILKPYLVIVINNSKKEKKTKASLVNSLTAL